MISLPLFERIIRLPRKSFNDHIIVRHPLLHVFACSSDQWVPNMAHTAMPPSRPPFEQGLIEAITSPALEASSQLRTGLLWTTVGRSIVFQGVTLEDNGALRVSNTRITISLSQDWRPQYNANETIDLDIQGWRGDSEDKDTVDWLGAGAQWACCLFSLCHVKNIEVREEGLHRGMRRRLERDGVAEAKQVRVKTLWIVPFEEKTPDGRSHRAAPTPFHFVRGHFVTYTDEAPLFGRYTGTFWREAHARGQKVHGEVKHRYAIAGDTEEKLSLRSVL